MQNARTTQAIPIVQQNPHDQRDYSDTLNKPRQFSERDTNNLNIACSLLIGWMLELESERADERA